MGWYCANGFCFIHMKERPVGFLLVLSLFRLSTLEGQNRPLTRKTHFSNFIFLNLLGDFMRQLLKLDHIIKLPTINNNKLYIYVVCVFFYFDTWQARGTPLQYIPDITGPTALCLFRSFSQNCYCGCTF